MSTETFSRISDSSNIESRSSKTNPNNLDLSNFQSTSSEEDKFQVMDLKFQRMFNFLSKKLQEQEKSMEEQKNTINEMLKSSNKIEQNSKNIKKLQEQLEQNDIMYQNLIKTHPG